MSPKPRSSSKLPSSPLTTSRGEEDEVLVEKLINLGTNKQALHVLGYQNEHLRPFEILLGVVITSRGNHVHVKGSPQAVEIATAAIVSLQAEENAGLPIDIPTVQGAIKLAQDAITKDTIAKAPLDRDDRSLKLITRKKPISPRTPGQRDYIRALKSCDLTFGLGPAGTGKTYLAVAAAVSELIAGRVERIILSRPAVEAGEKLGFLPGDMKEKVDPYLRPLYDALHDMLPGDQIAKYLQSTEIQIAPLAYMRGRTLSNAFVILDEAQNTTSIQMKMFLTRLGHGSKMAVNGDMTQIDLPPGQLSGLVEAHLRLKELDDVHFTIFTEKDVVRHPLVSKIITAYEPPLPSAISRKP